MRGLLLLLCLLAAAARAEPVSYRLDLARSDVRFTYVFEGAPRTGTMPVTSADIRLDFDALANSRVDVSLSAAQARAGFVFATETMKGPEVLDTASHPEIRFRSSAITGDVNGALVRGNLTVRGVTRPITLEAKLYRQQGSDLGDLNNLTVLLTGQIDRSDFGADGFPGYVGPEIGLRILARITR